VGQTRVNHLSTCSIHASPWVVICAAKYLNLQFPTELINRGQSVVSIPTAPQYLATCVFALGHPLRGTHKKMNGSDEQELREFVRLKHHSHELKRHHLAQSSLFRDQGVGGSNPLSPTNSFQTLTILRTSEIEPLVRLLWVPQLKCRFREGLASVDSGGLGHPIGAPIRIWIKAILSQSQ
jgi:hypothetical protein